MVTHIALSNTGDFAHSFVPSGYSPTFLLEDGTQSRTFVKKSLQAIFTQVLGDYPGNPLKKQLKAQHQDVLPYTVQYHETNFNFLSRLAAQQGEWLYYDGTTLQLGRGTGKTTSFRSNSAQVFTLSMHLQPGRTEGAHYNYRTHAPLKTKAVAPTAGHPLGQFAVQKSDELFTQPHRLQAGTQVRDQGQLQRALDGMAAKRAGNQVRLEGSGEAFDLAPGGVLDVQDAAGAAYGKFRVLAVRHEVDGDGNYANHFEALPDAAPAPPANPLYAATDAQPQLAEVIDLADPRGLGRLRVRYHWPVARPADAESSWVRVSTPYSGDGKGQLFTPEVGSQVLVGYEQGLAGFPVVLGNLFHPSNKQKASYSTPDNHRKGLQTAGGNKVVMSDMGGAQTILISNSNKKDTAILVSFKGDGSIDIKTNGPITISSGNSIAIEAKKDITMRAGDSISLEAKKNISVSTQEENVTVQAHKGLLLTAVTDDLTLEAASKKLTIQAANNVEITASAVVKVSGQDVKLNNPG